MPEPGRRREVLDEPCEPLGRARQVERLEAQARRVRADRGRSAALSSAPASCSIDVGDDAVVGGRGRASTAPRRPARRAVLDPAVVGAEVVAPVGDAVRLVDHEQADRGREERQHVVAEAWVVEPLRADQQQVDGRPPASCARDLVPLVAVGAVDRVRAQPEPLGRDDLVAHQREQRADDQRSARPRLRGAAPWRRSTPPLLPQPVRCTQSTRARSTTTSRIASSWPGRNSAAGSPVRVRSRSNAPVSNVSRVAVVTGTSWQPA